MYHFTLPFLPIHVNTTQSPSAVIFSLKGSLYLRYGRCISFAAKMLTAHNTASIISSAVHISG